MFCAYYYWGNKMDNKIEKLMNRFKNFLSKGLPNIFANFDEIQNKMLKYLENGEFSKSLAFAQKLKQDYKIQGGAKFLSLLETIASAPPLTEKKKEELVYPDKIEALTYRFNENTPDKQIIKINDVVSFEETKRISEIIVGNKLKEDGELVFPFVVSTNFGKRGRVIQKIGSRSPYNLVSVLVKGNYDNANFKITFIDDPKKQINYNTQRFVAYLHTYVFMSDEDNPENNMEYTILSETPLPILEDIEIKGMQIPLNDKIKIGNIASINKRADVIFLTDYKKRIDKIDDERFRQIILKYENNFDKLYRDYFGEFRHPKLFEHFLIGWLFASGESYGPTKGYKPNFGIIGPTRGGKSRLLDCIAKVFKETKQSENATIKSLVPNFGGTKPDAGMFLKTKRFLIAEEFLSKLHKSDGSVFGSLKSLLIHDRVNAGSGKFEGQSICGVPTSTMIFASNFLKPKITNMVELAANIEPSVLSRFIIYVQTREHFNYVEDRKHVLSKDKNISEAEYLPEYKISKIELYDYLLSKKVDFDRFNEFQIIDEVRELLPDDENLKEIYRGYNEHLVKLIDGITKKNYILDGRSGPMKVTEKDFNEAREIWKFIISSWSGDVSRLSRKTRIDFLTKKQRIVYEVILAKPGVTKKEIDYSLEEISNKYISDLIRLNLIKRDTLAKDSYVPINDKQMFKEAIEYG